MPGSPANGNNESRIAAPLPIRARRLFIVTLLAATGILGSLAGVVWEWILVSEARRMASDLETFYRQRIARELVNARAEAELLAAELEFLRLAEGDARQRSARLTAFFVSRGEFELFPAIRIATAEGDAVHSRGCFSMLQEAGRLVQVLPRLSESLYLRNTCLENEELYLLFARRLWLGAEGQGYIVLGQPLNHGWLRGLTDPGHQLLLYFSGRRYASSEGAPGMDLALDPRPLSDPRSGEGYVQALVSLGTDAPIIVVRAPHRPLVSAANLALVAALAVTLLLVLLWLVWDRQVQLYAGLILRLATAARTFRMAFRRADGLPQLVPLLGRRDELGQLADDLDVLMREVERRQDEERAQALTLQLLVEAVLELDLEGRLVSASPAWTPLCGQEWRPGAPLEDFLAAEDRTKWRKSLQRLAQGKTNRVTNRLRFQTLPGGKERWLELRLARHETPAGETHISGVARDITQTYLQEQRITHMALHDVLTGLPNRVLLEDRAKVALRLARRDGRKVALGFLDLDHFKHVNDSMGHKIGDALLMALSARLREQLREGDTLARWGGDEFVVLLPGMPDTGAIREVLQKLAETTRTALVVEGTPFNITFSAGFAVFPDDAQEVDTLLAQADHAMFHAKAQGRNHFQFYGEMARKDLGKQELHVQQRLLAKVRERSIQVHYQPVVRAREGDIIGMEALARWYEPDLGWVSPSTFIPMAENLGVVRELGAQVWQQALADLAALKAEGYALHLAVNLSRRQLFAPYFTESLCADLKRHALVPADIVLEITETTAMLDVEHAFERLAELARAGFRLSIDDFGTGYSSLSQLHEMHTHVLKIDISFVRRVHEEQGAKLVEAIVGMGHTFGLILVAEGVEDAATARRLTEMGVDCLQGHFFGAPMTAAALKKLLTRGSVRSA